MASTPITASTLTDAEIKRHWKKMDDQHASLSGLQLELSGSFGDVFLLELE
jgi:hypothetical protein